MSGNLYLDLPADDVPEFLAKHPGFEDVPGAHVLEAVYGDTAADGDNELAPMALPPRRAGEVSSSPIPDCPDMPKPWPTVIGYEGMPPTHAAGVAMMATDGRWVPVSRFDPPLSETDQVKANQRAISAYADRCAEFSVKGAVYEPA